MFAARFDDCLMPSPAAAMTSSSASSSLIVLPVPLLDPEFSGGGGPARHVQRPLLVGARVMLHSLKAADLNLHVGHVVSIEHQTAGIEFSSGRRLGVRSENIVDVVCWGPL